MLVMMFIFHCSLGDFTISIGLAASEVMRQLMGVLVFTVTPVSVVGGLGCVIMPAEGLCKVEYAKVWGSIRGLICALFLGFVTPFLIRVMIEDFMGVVPDLANTVGERDQLAALIAGSMTLTYTIYKAIFGRLRR